MFKKWKCCKCLWSFNIKNQKKKLSFNRTISEDFNIKRSETINIDSNSVIYTRRNSEIFNIQSEQFDDTNKTFTLKKYKKIFKNKNKKKKKKCCF